MLLKSGRSMRRKNRSSVSIKKDQAQLLEHWSDKGEVVGLFLYLFLIVHFDKNIDTLSGNFHVNAFGIFWH